jgi:hypothetical protein
MLDAHSALAADGGAYDLPRALVRERERQEREAASKLRRKRHPGGPARTAQ